MKKIHIMAIGGLGLLLSFFAFMDIASVKDDIARNEKVIKYLVQTKSSSEKEILDMDSRIKRITNDPAALQTVLIQKFKMVRKDQFVVNAQNN